MLLAELLRIEHRPKSLNIAFVLQPLQPRLAGGFRQADAPRQVRNRQPPIR